MRRLLILLPGIRKDVRYPYGLEKMCDLILQRRLEPLGTRKLESKDAN